VPLYTHIHTLHVNTLTYILNRVVLVLKSCRLYYNCYRRSHYGSFMVGWAEEKVEL